MEYLTIEDVATNLNVTRQTVAKFIQSKKLSALRISKNYRISVDDYNTFINRNLTIPPIINKTADNTKNCKLIYENKEKKEVVLAYKPKAKLMEGELVHKKKYNSFYFGDNLDVMPLLMDDFKGQIDLIYIDPPFGTGQVFSDNDNDVAYFDDIINQEFLEFLRKRLILLREFLSERGSIYLHIDKKIGHYVKIIMDEVFGCRNFINDITRIKCNPKNFSRKAYGNISDMLLFYSKEKDKNIWNEVRTPLSNNRIKDLYSKVDKNGRRYTTHPIHAPGETKNGDTGLEWEGLLPPKGRHWRYAREKLDKLDEEGLIEWSDNGNPRKIVYAKDHQGTKTQDVWEFKDRGLSYVDYPTQKSHEMLERIILNSSNKDSIILDCFAGSGSTLINAEKLGRKWIGIDNSIKSLETVKKVFSENSIKCNHYFYVDLI